MRHAANVLPVIPNLIVRLQTHPERYSRRFTLLSVILMIMSGVAFVITPRVFAHYVVFPTEALLLALVGGLSLGVAIHFARTAGSLPVLMTPTDQPISSDRVVWLPVVIGGVLLALVTEISVRWLDIPLLRNVDSHLQLALLGIGIALIVWGLSGTPKPRLPGITRAELLIVGGIILAALVIRLWGLDTTVRLLLDEMNFVDGARHAEDTTNLRILVPMSGLSPYTWLYSMLQADMGRIFGRSLTGVRAASAVLGAANVAALYFLARTLCDRRTAVIASVILITFPPHLHFSRIALLQVGDLFFGTMALAFTARALQRNQSIDWALAGISLGLTQYFFDAGRLLFTALVMGWLALTFITKQARWHIHRRGVFILAVGLVLVGAPVLISLADDGKSVLGRLNASGVGGTYWQEVLHDGISQEEMRGLVDRISRPFLFHVFYPENGNIYYAGTEPLVLRPLTPLFLLGVFYILWRWRNAAFVVLLWSVSAALAVGLFVVENMLTTRFVVSMPSLALLMAVGVRYALPMLFPVEEARGTTFSARMKRDGLMVTLVVTVVVMQAYYYFGPHLEHLNRTHREFLHTRDIWDVVLRAAELPQNTQTIIIASPRRDPIQLRNLLGYLTYDDQYPIGTYEPTEITPQWLVNLPPDRNYGFFIPTTDDTTMSLIYRVFEEAQPAQYTTTDMSPTEELILIYVPLLPDEIARQGR